MHYSIHFLLPQAFHELVHRHDESINQHNVPVVPWMPPLIVPVLFGEKEKGGKEELYY